MRTKILLLAVLFLTVCTSLPARKKGAFKPLVIENLEPKPDFWKVTPDEITDVCTHLERGRSQVIARTPFGYPVYAVFFGDFSEPSPQTNWSAGNSSSARKAYIPQDHRQTIVLLAGIHGSEPESVAAATNIIRLLDKGADFRGKADEEFLSLALNYRIIVVPCANMDGRSISPDHLRGQPYPVFRKACQGTWKDGSLIGWKGSKEWFPLPLDKVSYPGGYPNGDGYNIQHDCTPGDIRTAEMQALCRLFARWRVDFVLNSHSCEYQPHMVAPSQMLVDSQRKMGRLLYDKINAELLSCALRTFPREKDKSGATVNLDNLVFFCSGGFGMTLECSSSYDNIHKPKVCYTFEQLMEPVFVAMKAVMKQGIETPLACR